MTRQGTPASICNFEIKTKNDITSTRNRLIFDIIKVYKMKIGFCSPGGIIHEDYRAQNTLGIESQIFGNARELTNRGHTVFIFRRWHRGSETYETIENVNIVNVGSPGIPETTQSMTKLWFSFDVKQFIKSAQLDVLILNEVLTSVFLRSLPVPKLFITHNSPTCVLNGSWTKRIVLRQAEKMVFSACDMIVALNKKIAACLALEGYPVTYIANAVELKDYRVLGTDDGTVLYAGRLYSVKGVSYLVKAWAKLPAALREKSRLVIIGYGDEEPLLRRMASGLHVGSEVVFIPWLAKPKLIEHLSRCSAVVVPSLQETSCIVLMEAMACGKAVIASDIPGINEKIQHGHNGLLFESTNVEALSQQLVSVLVDEDLRKKLGHNARQTIESEYTFEHITSKYEATFKALAKE
jgi:glycosyltransferase involved in cell wall biosynthesis